MKQVLDNPTVGDVIDYLLQFQRGVKFVIEDPDTSWTINKIHITVSANEVCFTGEYYEMDKGQVLR